LKLIFFLLSLLSLSSCIAYQEVVELEILTPAISPIDTGIRSARIISNAKPQDAGQGNFTLKSEVSEEGIRLKKLSKDSIEVDSMISTCLYNFHNELNSPPFLSSVEIVIGTSPVRITRSNITSYFEDYPCDVLYILEDLSYTNARTMFYYGYYSTGQEEVTVTTDAKWSVYYKDNFNNPYQFTIQDTLFWNKRNIDRSDCTSQAIWKNAQLAGERVSPHWKTVTRLYNSNPLYTLSTAKEYVDNNEWEEAAGIWKAVYDSQRKGSKKKGRMAYNLSLYFESINKLDEAMEWLDSAESIFTDKEMAQDIELCQLYRKILKHRLIHQEELNFYFTK
jgi:hypothetical protein